METMVYIPPHTQTRSPSPSDTNPHNALHTHSSVDSIDLPGIDDVPDSLEQVVCYRLTHSTSPTSNSTPLHC